MFQVLTLPDLLFYPPPAQTPQIEELLRKLLLASVLIVLGKIIITVTCTVLVYMYIEESGDFTTDETQAYPYPGKNAELIH